MDIQRGELLSSEDIYNDLCLKIEKLEYMPGTKLSENELASVYGVSRHIVRNALATLKQRHLVDVFPQRGTFVSLIDLDFVNDVIYIRESVEQAALHDIIENISDLSDIISSMEKIAGQLDKLTDGDGYSAQIHELDNSFHRVLLAAASKPNIMSFIEEPYIHVRRWKNFEIKGNVRLREIEEEHKEIISAIKERNLEKGREALHTHLNAANRYAMALKEKQPEYFV